MSIVWGLRLVLAVLLAAALFYDIRARRIPNWLIVTGLAAGVGGAWVGSTEVGQSILGALTGLIIMLPFYLLRAMGAGDAKLMAVVGSFLGPMPVAGVTLLSLVAGGVFSLCAAVWMGSLPRVVGNLRLMGCVVVGGRASKLSLRDVQTTGRLPYALAICCGTGLQLWLVTLGFWPFR